VDNNRVTILPPASDGISTATTEVSLERMKEELRNRSSVLGGKWCSWPAGLRPLERILNAHARQIQIACLPISTLVLAGIVYYTLITVLGAAYGWLVAGLQAWEPPFSWLGGGGLGLAFAGASLLVLTLWKRAAIAQYRVEDPRTAKAVALAVTLAVLVIDFAASFTLLNASIYEASLGRPRISEVVVWLMAALTSIAQLLGTFLGWNMGLRHEVKTSWWSALTTSKAEALDRLYETASEIERRREEQRYARRNARPPAHVANTVNRRA